LHQTTNCPNCLEPFKNGILYTKSFPSVSGKTTEIEFDLQVVDSSNTFGVTIFFDDGNHHIWYDFKPIGIQTFTENGPGPNSGISFDTTNQMHKYKFFFENGNAKLFVNGSLLLVSPAEAGPYFNDPAGITFGDGSSGATGESFWGNILAFTGTSCNNAPDLLNPGTIQVSDTESNFVISLQVNDSDGDIVSIEIVSSQASGFTTSFVDNNDNTADITLDPSPNDLGTYQVVVKVTDSDGLEDQETFDIVVIDATSPIIILNGLQTLILEVGIDTYTEHGASVTDNDPEYSEIVTIGGDVVDTMTMGIYTVNYNALADASGNIPIEVTRTVNVTDTIPPVIMLNENSIITLLE